MKKKPENLYRNSKLSLPEIGVNVAKLIVSATAIIHLIISPIHVTALLLLENLICGFVMFLFILFGLLALFNALRTKAGHVVSMAAEIVILLVVIAMGIILASIYMNAIRFQTTLVDTAAVQKAFILSVSICSVYGLCAVVYAIDIIAEIRDGRYVKA